MRLKRIRLAGFKSFVDPTNIPFPGDMTAVVGPNGCGKSNVIDAVRWVLGESSAKNLRGDAMTDVIFNGSSARKPVSQCSVELVFDNSSGRIGGEYAKYNELSVKRIVTKDAISSYQLNSAKCRRRDITDLFLGTGLGPRSYAIIEQGMISKLIESKPQELRIFIEEAAGISKYKERRKETLNRISHTKDNLDRLEDVRQELGDQLAKLKRQAAAATRYKELKAQERLLKAQLATMRWLVQSELLKQSDDIIADYQQELEEIISGKQGDESGLQALKNDQSISKQAISDLQQQIYQLGNDITKLEQSQLFARKRGSQIQAEIDQLKQSTQQIKHALTGMTDELAQQEAQIMESEPEKESLQAQLDEVQAKQYEFQDKLDEANHQLKQAEDAYHAQKQTLQQKHGQLQQTLSLQQRTESRIHELKDELEQHQSQSDDQIQRLEENLSDLSQKLHEQATHTSQLESELSDLKQSLENEQRVLQQIETQAIQLQANFDALSALQQSEQQSPSSFIDAFKTLPAWQAFSIEEGYEKALETALNAISLMQSDTLVIEGITSRKLVDMLKEGSRRESAGTDAEALATTLLFQDNFSEKKTPGTLAQKVKQSHVPDIFNQYVLAETLIDAHQKLDSLAQNEYIVTREGYLINHAIFASKAKHEDGKVIREARLAELTKQLSQLAAHKEKQMGIVSVKEQAFELKRSDVSQAQQDFRETQNAHALLNRDVENAKQVKAQFEARLSRLLDDIAKQEEMLVQEQMSSESLTEEIEQASIDAAELESQKLILESDKQSLQIQLQAVQGQFQSLQSRLHEQMLLNQRLQNSYQLLKEQRKNKDLQIQENEEKILLLQEEAETLLLPSEDQQAKLQDMLASKEALSEQQQAKQVELEHIEEKIATIEKGQIGINAKIDEIKQKIESERLSAQTAKVKAQSFIEQLAEMKQNVKEVLENLPDDANEKEYQSQLDSVSASLSRLGAVNLAAVEEYEEQAVRKQHLDDQNTDLTQALETLENAMRKIDKETRAKFKHTFDQVNEDLKTLFPKVFGGGSAYLALTDDDLLETGVTIMARPPGKKNSTIHLLSGGEKALTALSLVFAIFRLNPAPFCLLDEVDAPLDDANVGRFCKLVSEMSKTVQFIYITHNKVAMEMATHLTGVTMAEPGVSRMVSVDMEEALAIAE
uniref:chromosome segregation protein SMC n=1 Tax=Ningiella ruwaisensis TaxID=2364274 RepID=UPI00109EE326|nr:chromosome segregation protein SMC [Ningiella ruwaisensis]